MSLSTHTVRINAKEVDRGLLSGHSSRRGLGAICAVCRAWRALKVFNSAGEDKMISRVSFWGVILYQASSIFRNVCVFAHMYHVYLKTARLATTVVPCAGTGLGYIVIQVC